MSSLQIGFWNLHPGLNPDFQTSLEVFYWRIPLVSDDPKPMMNEKDIDRLLILAADRPELDWLCVMAVGLVFPDQDGIADLIRAAIANAQGPFLVMGQLINKKGRYCGIHEQLFIVSLKTYRELGRPKFGNYEHGRKTLRDFEAGESIHDDYTPRWIKPKATESVYETWSCGWSFVDASLRAGLPVFNLPDDLRNEKVYAYPDDDLDRLNHNLRLLYQFQDFENSAQQKLFGYLINKRLRINAAAAATGIQLKEAETIVFLFNTEELLPNPEWTARNRRPLDTYLGPCAGFLDMAALYSQGFHEKTELVYFDINQRSLDFRRRLFAEFDGDLHGLVPFFEQAIAQAPGKPFYLGDSNLAVRRLLEVFGTAQAFRETWQRMRALPKKFHSLNLISSFHKLTSGLAKEDRVLFAISDIFTGQNELTYGHTAIARRFQALLDDCRRFPQMVISGKDLRGRPFIEYARNLTTAAKNEVQELGH